ncbi:MAG: class I SAM-dependent methyltransferase [Limisphaerales bacterium]
MSEAQSTDPAATVEMSTSEGYDRWAEIYDVEDNPLVILETDHFYRLLGDVRALKVLDVGCGTGRHAARLAGAGASVTGIDFSDGMLTKAREKSPEVDFQQQDIQQPLRFDDDEFDRVICGLVVDHVSKLRELFSEMARVCKADGSVVVSVMHPAMMLTGARARFTDPQTGKVTYPESVPNQVSDYVTAAIESGLRIEHISEHIVDKSLTNRSPRAGRYLGWPLLLLLKLRP